MTDFIDRAAKIIAEIRNRTSIDKIDTSVLEDILQDELIKYHNEVFTYGHSIGYDDGHSDGYYEGYDAGQSDGYALGYDDGCSEGSFLGYNFAKDEVENERLQH